MVSKKDRLLWDRVCSWWKDISVARLASAWGPPSRGGRLLRLGRTDDTAVDPPAGPGRRSLSLAAASTLIKCGLCVDRNPDLLWIQNVPASLLLSGGKTRPWQMSFWAFADHSSTEHNSLILSLRAIYRNRGWLIGALVLGKFSFPLSVLNPLWMYLKEMIINNTLLQEEHRESLSLEKLHDFIHLK